jgi:Zn-dependent protease with chaperone function
VSVARPPRPSPFAFPSDTTFRFALLVAAVLGATLYVWSWMWSTFGAEDEAITSGALDCLELTPTGGGDFAASSAAFTECTQRLYRDNAWWMLGGAALVVGVAIAIAVAWPYVKERRARLQPLTGEDAPEVLATLRELAVEAGLDEEPRWMWSPLARAASGNAYGHAGRHAVALTGGLVVLHATDPAAFRAIVRHELAHVRNRDVDVTYLTLSFWYAFLAAAVLPFVLTLLDQGKLLVSATWRMLALAALVYLTRNAVLRSREVYADVRASASDGPSGALRRVVGTLRAGDVGLRKRLLALHPTPDRRLAALDDPRPLLSLGVLEAFGAGLAATINFDSVASVVTTFVGDPITMNLLSALVFAPLIAGVVGLALWRSRFGALAAGGRPQRVLPIGLALTAGLVLGPELALAGIVPGAKRTLLGGFDLGNALWIAALALLVVLLLDWITDSSSLWLRMLAARRSRLAVSAGLAVAAGVLTVVLGVYYALRASSVPIDFSRSLTAAQHSQVADVAWAGPRGLWQLVMDPQTLVVVSKPVVPLALVALWAFPLAAGLVRRRRVGEAPWAFLDPGGRLEPGKPRLAILRPLAVGAIAGAACLVAFALLRGGIHYGVSWETRQRDELILSFFFWQLVLALGAQAAAGGVATALARDVSRLAEGLFAAFVAGTIATFGIVAGPVAGGCVGPIGIRPGPCTWDVSAGFTWDVWRQTIAEGAVVATAAGLAVVAARALARRRAHRAELGPARLSGA